MKTGEKRKYEKAKLEFLNRYRYACKIIFLNDDYVGAYHSLIGQKIVMEARKQLHYKITTMPLDIFLSLRRCYRRKEGINE